MPLDLSFIPDDPRAAVTGAPAAPGKKALDLSFIPDAGSSQALSPSGRPETISADRSPKWDDLALWDKLTVLSNPMTLGAGWRQVFKESPEEAQAKAINSLAIADKLKLPPSAVYENYDKLIKDPTVTGLNFSGPGRDSSSPISRAYEFGAGLSKLAFPALIGSGLVSAPLATLKGLAAFTGASEGLKAGGSLVAGKPYHFGMEASELLPADSGQTIKNLFDMAEFFGSALAAGGLVSGWNKIIPGVRGTIAEKLFRDTITEFKAPQKIYVSPERVRDLQLGKEDIENQLIKDLNLPGSQWRQALRMGVDIEVPAEKVIRLVDKPWFARLKEDLNKTGVFTLSPFERVKVERGDLTGRPRPSGLLPAPEGAATGLEPGVTLSSPEPGSASSPPLYQTEMPPATEALDKIKADIEAAGFDKEYSESVAALLDARSRTWAVQTGKTPAEYFEKWGIEFKRGIWNPRNKTRESSNLGGKKETLIGWLKQRGGLWDETLPGETAQFGSKESGLVGLVRKGTGQAFDELADHAVQDGWLPEGATARDFIDLLSQEFRAIREKKPEARAVKVSDNLDQAVQKTQEAGDRAMVDLGEEAQAAMHAGFDYYGPHHEVAAGSLEQGDKLMILGEVYEHQGLDENGRIKLKGEAGEYAVAPDDLIPAEAIKKINQPIYDGQGLFQGVREIGRLPKKAILVKDRTDRNLLKTDPDWKPGKESGDKAAADRFADKFWSDKKTEKLKEIIRDPVSAILISMPSTSSQNIHPLALGEKLARDIPGLTLIDGGKYFDPIHSQASKDIPPGERMFHPREYDADNIKDLQQIIGEKKVYIVDDIFTSGGSTKSFIEALNRAGFEVEGAVGYMGEARLEVDRKTHDKLVDAVRRANLPIKAGEIGNILTRSEVGDMIRYHINKAGAEDAKRELVQRIQGLIDRRERLTREISGLSDQGSAGYAGQDRNQGRPDGKPQGEDQGHEGSRSDLQAQSGDAALKETFQGARTPKGSLSFTDQHKAVITFFQSADLSTAPHEIFHLFLEDLKDTAEIPGVSEQVQKDFKTVLDWLGASSWEEVGTAQKERWARAGEKYLGSGKAPSVELRSAFERFKDWILSIYQKLRDLNVNLSKKMRGVFGRLLATEEEIQTMKAEMDIRPLWPEGRPPLGITPEAWEQYGDLARRAAQSAQEAIEGRRISEYNEAKARWTQEAEAAYKENLEHQLAEYIVNNGGLNRDKLLREFDEDTVKALTRRRPGLVRQDGALDHEMVAFGSNDITTDRLISILLNSPTKEEFIDQYIKTQSEEFDSQVPVGEAAITEEYLEMLGKEMDLLMAAVTQGTGRAPRNSEVKKRVRRETGQTRVDTLVTETDALKAGLQMAARAAREAATAGRMEEALVQKGRQREIVMNLKAKYEAQREIEKTRDYFMRVARSRTIDWDFQAQILDVLADHEIISRQDFPREAMPSLRAFVAGLQAEGETLDISEAMLDRAYIGSHQGRTYEQLMDIRDTVKQLEHLGRIKSKLIAEDKERELAEALEDITHRIYEVYSKKFKEPTGFVEFEARKNILQKAAEYKNTFVAELLKPEVIIRLLDGLRDQGMGPVWQNTFAKIKTAEDREIVLGRDFTQRLKAIFEAIPKAERRKWLDQKVSIPEIPQQFLTREKMIMVALNSGNEGNRRALREGSATDPEIKWTDAQIQAITDKLSKAEWELVQQVWSLINELYDPLNRVHQTLTGVPLKKVEGIPVQTPYGEIDGQYFPLVFDPRQSKKAERFEMERMEKDYFANIYRTPAPASGFTKERVGGKMFPLLDFGVITRHINDTIHFASHALEIRDVNKILSSHEVRASIEQAMGEAVYKQFNPWLQFVARSQHQPQTAVEHFLGKLRANSAIVVMGLKASTALMQPLAATQAIEYLGLVPYLKGMAVFYAHPLEWSAFIKEKSPMMSVRYSQETLDREMALFAKQFKPAGAGVKEVLTGSFFAWMNVMDASATYPCWLAAYKKGMDYFQWNEAKAIMYADQAVRLAQASGAVKDQALFYQGKEGLKKLFGMFQTFFNAFFNRLVERNRGWGLGEVGIMGLVAAYTWSVLVPATIQYSVQERKIPTPVDIGREGLNYLLLGMPVLRDLGNLFLSDYDIKPSPAFKAYDEANYLKKSVMAKDPKTWNIVKHSLQIAGYATGLPTAQAVITLEALLDLAEGKEINPLNLLLREPKEKKQ